MPDTVALQHDSTSTSGAHASEPVRHASTSLRELCRVLWRRRLLIAVIEGSLLALCLVYCLIAPNHTRRPPASNCAQLQPLRLTWKPHESLAAASILSAPMALETLASVLRSDQLAWRVIIGLKLYQASGFCGNFVRSLSRLSSGRTHS